MKNSKVLTVQPMQEGGQPKTYQSKNGLLYSFWVTMENKDAGEYQAKTLEQDYFIVGKDTDYEYDITYPNYPKIKRAQKEFSNFKGSKPGNNRSFALSYAKDVWVAKIALKEIPEFKSKDCILLADLFVKWLDEGSKVIQDKPDNISVDQSELVDGYKPPPAEGDDLPF